MIDSFGFTPEVSSVSFYITPFNCLTSVDHVISYNRWCSKEDEFEKERSTRSWFAEKWHFGEPSNPCQRGNTDVKTVLMMMMNTTLQIN